MLEIILFIIFIVSLIGLIIIIRSKIPFLVELSLEQASSSIFDKLKNKTKKDSFSRSIFLQKFLSKIRILILKSDNKTNEWIKRLRQKSQENKTKFSDNYWDKLKK